MIERIPACFVRWQIFSTGKRNAVEEDVTEDAAFVTVPVRSCAGDDDALRVHHLAHHAAGTVRRRHQNRAKLRLLRRNPLQAPGQDVRIPDVQAGGCLRFPEVC